MCYCSDHNGVSSLKKIEIIKEEGEFEVEGAFGNPAAKEVLNKAKELQRYNAIYIYIYIYLYFYTVILYCITHCFIL